jgi:hypothetical protein
MHPNPKPKTIVLWSALNRLSNGFLYGNGTLDRIHSARELGQDTVASGVGDPTAMLSNEAVHDLAVGRQGTEGSDLVLLHQARISCDISRKDGCKPSLDSVLLFAHGSLGAVPERSVLLAEGRVQSTGREHPRSKS